MANEWRYSADDVGDNPETEQPSRDQQNNDSQQKRMGYLNWTFRYSLVFWVGILIFLLQLPQVYIHILAIFVIFEGGVVVDQLHRNDDAGMIPVVISYQIVIFLFLVLWIISREVGGISIILEAIV